VSVHALPAYQSAYFTCDFIGGKPGHRSACRAATTVRLDQGDLFLTADWADPPEGWNSHDGGHLCPDHTARVPKDGQVSSFTFHTTAHEA
jgi:hypothetical protein